MTTWTTPAIDHIEAHSSDPVARVIAALEALDDAYATAVTQVDPDPSSGFDPARGSTPISFALLDLRDLRPAPDTQPEFPDNLAILDQEPGTLDDASAGLRDLLHHTADIVLAASDDPTTTTIEARLLADIMGALAVAHQWTFGTSW